MSLQTLIRGARLRDVERPELGGVVLTGGAAVRFQGADKASIEVGGATLLEHVLGRARPRCPTSSWSGPR